MNWMRDRGLWERVVLQPWTVAMTFIQRKQVAKRANMVGFQSFAILPAAGHSRRMGSPKLLLPWKAGTVIEQVLAAWRASSVNRTLVVVRKDQQQLIRICRGWDVDIVVPDEPPAEMKHSVQAALKHIKRVYQPEARDVFLLAPADMPRLSTELIDQLLVMHEPRNPSILVPVFGGRRGHPVLIPWPLYDDVLALDREHGVNSLLERHRLRTLPVEESACLQDLDEPIDYRPPQE